MAEQSKSLYTRLGGYDAITAVVEDLLPRLMNDLSWGDSGKTGVRMGCAVKNSS